MDGLLTFLIFAALFYLMMRFGCGAHMVHGHGGEHGAERSEEKTDLDPVCGKQVPSNEGYGKAHAGRLYRFCSRECLDTFDSDPDRYIEQQKESVP